MSERTCLGRATALADPFLDRGTQPLVNTLVRPEGSLRPERRYRGHRLA